MKFNRPEITEQLALNQLSPGATVKLDLRGNLLDGTPFVATDCILIVPLPPNGMNIPQRSQGHERTTLHDLFDNWGPCFKARNCPGDLDGDGSIGVFDLMRLLSERP